MTPLNRHIGAIRLARFIAALCLIGGLYLATFKGLKYLIIGAAMWLLFMWASPAKDDSLDE